jgi:hypothetical protein
MYGRVGAGEVRRESCGNGVSGYEGGTDTGRRQPGGGRSLFRADRDSGHESCRRTCCVEHRGQGTLGRVVDPVSICKVGQRDCPGTSGCGRVIEGGPDDELFDAEASNGSVPID